MMPTTLAIDLIKTDSDTQCRAKIDEPTVDDYSEILAGQKNWRFPPVHVFHDGTEYHLADGFHRVLAAHRVKRASIPCEIHQGTATDAKIYGMTANDNHGLRMTRDDKRKCVEWLLDQPGKRTQEEIAEIAGVTARTVRNVVAERRAKTASKNRKVSAFGHSEGAKNQGLGSATGSEPVEESTASDKDGTDGSTEAAGGDFDDCPNCGENDWDTEGEDMACRKCHHPHGEPAGDQDVLDSLDRVVPPHFLEAYQLGARIASVARNVDKIVQEVRDLANREGGQHLAVSAIETAAGDLKTLILGGAYWTEDPFNDDWIPRSKRGHLTKEQKTALGV